MQMTITVEIQPVGLDLDLIMRAVVYRQIFQINEIRSKVLKGIMLAGIEFILTKSVVSNLRIN